MHLKLKKILALRENTLYNDPQGIYYIGRKYVLYGNICCFSGEGAAFLLGPSRHQMLETFWIV